MAVGVISRLYAHGLDGADLRVLPLRAPTIERNLALMVRRLPGPRSSIAADCFGRLVEALQVR